jgi:hypothetical protein
MKLLFAAAALTAVWVICFVKGSAEFPSGQRTETGQSNAEIAFRRIVWIWRLGGGAALAFAVGALIAGFPQ